VTGKVVDKVLDKIGDSKDEAKAVQNKKDAPTQGLSTTSGEPLKQEESADMVPIIIGVVVILILIIVIIIIVMALKKKKGAEEATDERMKHYKIDESDISNSNAP